MMDIDPPQSEEEPEEEGKLVFKAMASHMMSAFKSGDVESLAMSLEILCEYVATEDESSDNYHIGA